MRETPFTPAVVSSGFSTGRGGPVGISADALGSVQGLRRRRDERSDRDIEPKMR